MPIKYKEDTIVKDRMTGKITTQRFFIHTLSTPLHAIIAFYLKF